MGNQVAQSSHAAPPLLVRTVRNTHRLDSGQEYRIGRDDASDIPLLRRAGVVGARGDPRGGPGLGARGRGQPQRHVPRLRADQPHWRSTARAWCTSGTRRTARCSASSWSSRTRCFRSRGNNAAARVRRHHVHAWRAPRPHLARPDPGAGHADRPPPGQRHRRVGPRACPSSTRSCGCTPTGRYSDHRPGQPQRHVRQRHQGQPGRAERRRHHRDRPRHLPAGRRRADRVRRRRPRHVRGARAAGRGARRRQAEGAARGHHVPARRAVDDGGHRPGRRGQVHAAQRADRQAPGDRRAACSTTTATCTTTTTSCGTASASCRRSPSRTTSSPRRPRSATPPSCASPPTPARTSGTSGSSRSSTSCP